MRIVCPQCGYSRDIPAEKVPARSSMATCPKCQFRFRFRGTGQAARTEEPQDIPQRITPTVVPDMASGVVIEEPVYPPRPSRPVRSEADESYEYRPRPPYEPRISRAVRPEPEPEPMPEPEPAPVPHDHHRPRPQARWLPDPEPGSEDEPSPRPRPRFPRATEPEPAPAPPEPDAPWGRLGDDQPLDAMESRESRTPYEPPEAPAAPWERLTPGNKQDPTHFHGEEESAPEVVRERPASLSRLDAIMEEVSPGSEESEADAAFSMPDPERPAPAGHESEVPPADPATPEEESYWDQAQAPQAVAGDDSVRDIWARLQSMSGETRSALQDPGKKDGKKDKPRAEKVPLQPRAYTGETVVPWEQLEHYGAVPAFMNTAKNILFKPGDFFDQLPESPGKLRPLVFAAVVCVVATLAGLVWNYFGMGPNFAELGRTDGFQGLGSGAIGGLALMGLAPLLLMAFSFLDAGVTQLLLLLLRASTRSFEETFRALCYAGCPWLLAALPAPYSYLIPVVLIWHMTLQAIGLKKLHQTGYPQILASVLVKWSFYFMASFAVLHLVLTRR